MEFAYCSLGCSDMWTHGEKPQKPGNSWVRRQAELSGLPDFYCKYYLHNQSNQNAYRTTVRGQQRVACLSILGLNLEELQ